MGPDAGQLHKLLGGRRVDVDGLGLIGGIVRRRPGEQPGGDEE